MKTWYLYALLCSDGTIYTGVCIDVQKRLHDHNHTSKGARYTRSRRPVTLIGYRVCGFSRGEAQRVERRFKKLSHKEKMRRASSWSSP